MSLHPSQIPSGFRLFLPFSSEFDSNTWEDIPFGGSRLFSVNTQTNKMVTIRHSGVFIREWDLWVRQNADARERGKKKRELLRKRARRLCADGCTEWKVIGKYCQAKCSVSIFSGACQTFISLKAKIMSMHQVHRLTNYQGNRRQVRKWHWGKNMLSKSLKKLLACVFFFVLLFFSGWRSKGRSFDDKISTQCTGPEGERWKGRSIWGVQQMTRRRGSRKTDGPHQVNDELRARCQKCSSAKKRTVFSLIHSLSLFWKNSMPKQRRWGSLGCFFCNPKVLTLQVRNNWKWEISK